VDAFPDLTKLSDTELKQLISELEEKENELSYERRLLHGKIDILRAERAARSKKKNDEGEVSHVDVADLSEILSAKATPPAEE
jgi:hypothetical protein